MPRVNPENLRWARETAGLGLEDAARKLALAPAGYAAGGDRLAALERGDAEPNRPLLVRMAKQYRRPLLAFYLASPPPQGDRGHDFRTLPDDEADADGPILDALIRDVMTRQALVRTALADEEDPAPLAFVGSMSRDAGVTAVAGRIRATLGISLAAFRAASNPDEAFRLLRAAAEAAGVFVILLSNLGSHHTALSPESFRGLAIADSVAPFVVVNDQDSRAAWSFTLLHELAHILLGETGVSGGTPDRDVERFCNDVASEFLLPSSEMGDVVHEFTTNPGATVAERIGQFAAARNVSRSMMAYRLYRRSAISEAEWRAVRQGFRQDWLQERDRQRERGRETSGGPSYYAVRRFRVGEALLRTTARLLLSGALTTTKAGRVLGVKPGNVGTLIAGAGARGR
ncbi:DNA-binding protein [Gemmatimonadetes bacterium T265]|nr:DNA-binding protein [Gemmatimonadetes bacterium T265]